VVRVRVLGNASLGWIDSFILWGACVELFICQGGNVRHLVEQLYPDTYIAPLDRALCMPPFHGWDGILAATLSSSEEANQLRDAVKAWRPMLVLITSHGSVSRKAFTQWLPFEDLHYAHHIQHRCHHDKFGGVTNSMWRLAIGIRDESTPLDASLAGMTAGLYSRHLQTALDDTLGSMASKEPLEMESDARSRAARGERVATTKSGNPVFDGNGLGPDPYVPFLIKRDIIFGYWPSRCSQEIEYSGRYLEWSCWQFGITRGRSGTRDSQTPKSKSSYKLELSHHRARY
jgi:hypothetical protein